MSLTPEQLEQRRGGVGASDVPAIFGQDEYRNPQDVWVEKVYGLVPEETKDIDARVVGDAFEGGMLTLAERHWGFKVQRDPETLRRPMEGSPLVSTLDGWVEEDGQVIPVEAKTTGLINPMSVDRDEWGETGSDHIPWKFILQVSSQCMATGAPYGYLAAFIGGLGPRFYRIDLHETIAGEIDRLVREFWSCVQERREPDYEVPHLETLKRMRRVEDSAVRIPHDGLEPIHRLERIKSDLRVMEKAKEDAMAEAIWLLNDAECAKLEIHMQDAERIAAAKGITVEKAMEYQMLSYFEEERTYVDRDVLRRDFPEAWKAASYKKATRVLRLRRAPTAFIERTASAPLIDPHQLRLQPQPESEHDTDSKETA